LKTLTATAMQHSSEIAKDLSTFQDSTTLKFKEISDKLKGLHEWQKDVKRNFMS
jgi:hypothetical protein